MNLSNGLLNLTNWLGNVIMPTMAGLFAAAAIYRFSKAHPYSHLGYAALASLMCSGLLRAMESFSNQASWNNPDRYWISVLTLVNWVGNVLLPLYGAGQVVLAVVHFAGLLERMTIGEAWGAQPGRSDVLFRIVGTVALGRILDSTRHGGSALGRSYEMPLQVTPVNRNLQTRVTFMLLELEDLFIVLGAAAIMNVVGHFVGGEIAGMPMNIVLQYGVLLLMVPVLMAFKYGKPRGYVRDLAFWYTKSHAYCAIARDREIRSAYLREE